MTLILISFMLLDRVRRPEAPAGEHQVHLSMAPLRSSGMRGLIPADLVFAAPAPAQGVTTLLGTAERLLPDRWPRSRTGLT